MVKEKTTMGTLLRNSVTGEPSAMRFSPKADWCACFRAMHILWRSDFGQMCRMLRHAEINYEVHIGNTSQVGPVLRILGERGIRILLIAFDTSGKFRYSCS